MFIRTKWHGKCRTFRQRWWWWQHWIPIFSPISVGGSIDAFGKFSRNRRISCSPSCACGNSSAPWCSKCRVCCPSRHQSGASCQARCTVIHRKTPSRRWPKMRMHASPQMSFNIGPSSLWFCNHNYNIIIYQHQTNTTNTTKCNKCTCICFTLF